MNYGRYLILKRLFSPSNSNSKYRLDGENVINIKTNRRVKTFISEDGYKMLALTRNNKSLKHKGAIYALHEIIAFNKFGKKIINKTVDHKNENKLDNSQDNLQLLTQGENTSKSQANKPKPCQSTLTIDDIYNIKKLLSLGIKGCEIAKRFSVTPGLISHIKTGKKYKDIIPDGTN